MVAARTGRASLFTPLISAQAEEYHQMFYEYYGYHDWADKWVMAALDSTATNFNAGGGQAAGVAGGGNADFSTINDAATRDQCVKKGVVYMNDWHYAIHEMNAAIKACRWDSADNNNEAAHKWDEAVAFYAGSLVSTSDGDDAGSLMYGISESRGKNFKTINDDGDAANNVEVYKDFNEGELGAISDRSRRDLGPISARSRTDLGPISDRSRRELGATPTRSRRDSNAISALSRVYLGRPREDRHEQLRRPPGPARPYHLPGQRAARAGRAQVHGVVQLRAEAGGGGRRLPRCSPGQALELRPRRR